MPRRARDARGGSAAPRSLRRGRGRQPTPLAARAANRTAGARRRQRWFNLGLPRTGTTWFSAVASHLGLKSLHCNEPSGCHGVAQAALLEAFDRAGARPAALWRLVSPFDAFSDVPWYTAEPALLTRVAPRAGIFVTTRGVDAWFASLQHSLLDEAPNANCSTDPLLRYAALVGARVCAGGRLSRRRRDWQALFYEHHARVLRLFPAATVLDLSTRSAAEESVRLLAQRAGAAPLDGAAVRRLALPRNARLIEHGRVIRGVERSWTRHDF